jgi:hypothetical protein
VMGGRGNILGWDGEVNKAFVQFWSLKVNMRLEMPPILKISRLGQAW